MICAINVLSGQTMEYRVMKGSKQVGIQKATRTEQNSNEYIYRIKSDVCFSFVTKRNMSFTLDVASADHLLYKSDYTEFLNDKLRGSSYLVLEDDQYAFTKDDVYSVLPYGPDIVWTTARMYFEEPIGVSEVFAERHGQYLNLTKINENSYALTKPNGRVNTYSYANGVCESVVVDHWLATIRFERIY